MRVARFQKDGREAYGVLDGETVRFLDGGTCSLSEVRLLPPSNPTKIIALGLNYREHIKELGHETPAEPVIFLKPSSAVIGPGGAIRLPPGVGRVDYEAELALVIGKAARNLTRESALECVFGVTCMNDVTARDLQKKDGQWTRAKGFDTFAPLGPWVETEGVEEPRAVECLVNGEVRQSGTTADLITGLRDILVFVSGIMTLLPGDVIATGTPPGVGPLAPGDRVEVRIAGVGSLINDVELGGHHT